VERGVDAAFGTEVNKMRERNSSDDRELTGVLPHALQKVQPERMIVNVVHE
jgi:hypothetical protein